MLNKNRANIVDAFTALRSSPGRVERAAQTKDDFAADFKDLYPVIKALNDNADDLIKDLEFLPTFPFHYKYLRNAVRGDYLNVYITFDLTLRRIGETMFTTSWVRPEHEATRVRSSIRRTSSPGHGEPVRPGRRSVQDPARHGDTARGAP